MKRRFCRSEGGNAAVEFALIVPVLFTMILGIISMSALYYSQASMHTAAEWAARYWATSDAGWSITANCTFGAPVTGTVGTPPVGCTSAASGYTNPADYAKNHYRGVTLTGLTFSSPQPTTGVCTTSGGTFGGPGLIVHGSGTYNFNAMFVNIPVNMSTQACYPLIQ